MAQLKIDLIVDNKGSVQIHKFALDAEKGIARIGGNVDGLNKHFQSLGSGIKTAFAGLGGAYALRELIGIADNFTLMESRLRLVTKSEQELQRTEAELFQIAQQTRGAYAGTVDLYTRLARSTRDVKVSQSDLLAVTKGVGEALIVSGGSASSADAAIMQLGQGLASGTLRGEELNSILEQTPRVAQMIADGLGTGIGQLKKFGAEGKLTSEVVIKALLNQTASVNAEFTRMETTVGQAGTVLSNTLKALVDDANDGAGATKSIASSIMGLSETVGQNKDEILSLFQGIVTGAEWSIERISNLIRSVKGAAAVAAGALDLSDFATMNPDELKRWMADFDNGTADIQKRLSEARKELAGLSDSTPGIAPQMANLNKQVRDLEVQLKAAEQAHQGLGAASLVTGEQLQNTASSAVKLGDSYKTSTEATKQQREELRQTVAEAMGLVSAYRLTTDSLKEWEDFAGKSREDMNRLASEYSSVGGGEVARVVAEQNQAYLEGLSIINRFNAALAESGQVAAQAQAEYSRAQADLAALSKELEQNPTITSTERENRLAPLTDAVRQKAEATRKAMSEQLRLNEANEAGVLTEQQLRLALFESTDALDKRRAAEIFDLESSGKIFDNITAGLALVADESGTRGHQIAEAIQGGFASATDALTDFVTTGKLEFSSLTDSILSDLARIVIQQSITGPIAGGLSAALGGWLSSGVNSGTYSDVSSLTSGILFANGGVMTASGPLQLRQYASGGVATSPQVSIYGEGSRPEAYVPLPDGRSIPVTMSGGSGGNNVVVNVIEDTKKSGTTQTRSENGTNVIDVFVDRIKNAVASDIASGSGVVPNALQSTYGLNRSFGGN